MKQPTINSKLSHSYKLFDAITPKVCSGCGRSDKVLHHSHIISQQRCKQIGKPELIWKKTPHGYNFVYDCIKCHATWEAVKNPKWKELNNILYRIDILMNYDPKGYQVRIQLGSVIKIH